MGLGEAYAMTDVPNQQPQQPEIEDNGDFVRVRITDCDVHDLYATPIE